MAKSRKEPKTAKDIKLKHPDRSGPSEATLLDLAQDRGLFDAADERQSQLRRKQQGNDNNYDDDDDDDPEEHVLSPRAERIMEAMLWTVTMAMGHFTFDVLVQHQYAVEIKWPEVCMRAATAWAVFLLLFYPLHPHHSNPMLLPSLLPLKHQHPLRQAIFFVMSCVCGPYLIYISNEFSYLHIMKQAPPLGVLWLWSVIELDLAWAALSLAVAGGYLWKEGYSIIA